MTDPAMLFTLGDKKACGYYFERISGIVKKIRKTKIEMDRLTGSFSNVWNLLGKKTSSLDNLLQAEIDLLENLSGTTGEMSNIFFSDKDKLFAYFDLLKDRVRRESAYKPVEVVIEPADIPISKDSTGIIEFLDSLPAKLIRRSDATKLRLARMMEQNTREYAAEAAVLVDDCETIAQTLKASTTVFHGECEHLKKVGPPKLHKLEASTIGKLLGETLFDIREMNRTMMDNVSRGYTQLTELSQLSVFTAKYIRHIELLRE